MQNFMLLYVTIVTLSSQDNVKLSKLLNEGFKRSIYWSKYKLNPYKIVILLIMVENTT